MSTPFATRGTGDLIIRDGDTVSGDSATGGAGGNVTVEGGNATAASATDGGDVILQPGLEDGAGSIGEVSVTNRTGTEDDPIIAFSSASGNSHTIRWRVGTIEPNSDLVPASAGGDLYVRSDGTIWIASAAGTANWSEVGSGGGTTSRIAQSGVITEGLEFFVDFNNQSSWVPNQTTTWTDTIAGLAGTTSGTVTITDGHLNFGTGLTTDVDFGSTPSAIATMYAGGGTVMGWIRCESDGGGNLGRVYDAGFGSTPQKNHLLYVSEESGGVVRLNFYHFFTGTDGAWETTVRDITLNEWVHVAAVYDSDDVSNVPVLYINGVSVAVTPLLTPTLVADTSTGPPLILGDDENGSNIWDGDIEMLGLYSSAKAAAEITDIYNATKGRFTGGATWAAALTAGNTSGGTDAEMTNGDTLHGEDVTSGSGGILALRGGDTTVTGLVNGGDVTIDGGEYAGTSGFARGGNLTLQGGPVTSTGGNGGAINLIASTPGSNNGTGGAVFITSGDGGTGGGNATGGNLSILSGDGKVSGAGGTISIVCGDSISFGAGADMSLTAGSCTGNSGQGGDLNLTGGAGSEVGGDVFITAGAKTVGFGTPNNSGNVVIKSGAAAVDGTTIGSITLQTPNVNDVAAGNIAGAINLITGNGGLTNSDGGHLNVTLGTTQVGATNQAGSMFVICGADVAGTSSSTGGEFSVICGDTNIGTAGRFIVAAGDSTSATGSGGDVIVTSGVGGATSGANGNVVFTTQDGGGTGAPGYTSFRNDGTSTTVAREGEFRVETDKSQFSGNYIGTRTGSIETTDVTLTRLMTVVTVATNYRIYSVTATISGIATASADTITRTYQAAYYRSTGGATLVGQTTVNSGDTGTGTSAPWAAQLTTSGNDVFIQVQGENAKTVRWIAQVTVQEGGQAV